MSAGLMDGSESSPTRGQKITHRLMTCQRMSNHATAPLCVLVQYTHDHATCPSSCIPTYTSTFLSTLYSSSEMPKRQATKCKHQ